MKTTERILLHAKLFHLLHERDNIFPSFFPYYSIIHKKYLFI